MILEVKAPSPGESISEVIIAAWLVTNGSKVQKDQEIAEIETDKATLSIVADISGTIEFKANIGDSVKVGELICLINSEGEDEKELSVSNIDLKTEANRYHHELKITPLAKQLLLSNELNIKDINTSSDRIKVDDVKRYLDSKKSTTNNEVGITRKKMSTIRKTISQRLVAVRQETAMLTTFNEVDMQNVNLLREKYAKAFQDKHGVKLGIMSFFIKAVVQALQQYPSVNAMIEGDDIVYFNYYNINIAMQSSKGLLTPVIKNSQELTFNLIEKKIAELGQKSRAGKISIDELKGGTFTITNGGVFGSLMSTPILNPPQCAILGLHNIIDRPVAIDGKVVIRPMMYIALSYDHRLIDGRDSVGFLMKIKNAIENPQKFLFNNQTPDFGI